MGKRILNRKELRDNYDAAERRKTDDDETPEEEGDADDEEEETDEADADAEGEGEEDEEKGESEDEDAPVVPKKKKKAAKAPKVAKPKSRSRAAKVVRLRMVWGVFNNSHQCVATYEFPKRSEADAHAAKLTADKKTTHFVQPVKEPIEEPKEKA